jgi:hypothetical protein
MMMMFTKTLYFAALVGATAAANHREGNERRMLRSFDRLVAKGGQNKNISCKDTEQSCMNDDNIVLSCGSWDGAGGVGDGCACPEGLTKCYDGCAWGPEVLCTDVCCNDRATDGSRLQETCYPNGASDPKGKFCANVEDGGCPCPEGEKKCSGEFDEYSKSPTGTCIKNTSLCCDYKTHETCGDFMNPDSCALIADGGCPCADDEVKCNADQPTYAGYCAKISDGCSNEMQKDGDRAEWIRSYKS